MRFAQPILRMFVGRSAGLLAAVAILSGCAPSLTTLQPARIVPPHHVQVTAGVDFTLPKGEQRELIENARDIRGGGAMTPEEIETATEAIAAVMIQAPALGHKLSLAYGVSRRWEIGLRTHVASVGAWTRYQFLRVAPGIYGSFGFGMNFFVMSFPIQAFVDEVEVDHHRRAEFDLPIHLGYSSRLFHIWGGPKLVFARYDTAFTACVDESSGNCVREVAASLEGRAIYAAGQLGMAIGWRRWWIAAEISIARLMANADLAVEGVQEGFTPRGRIITPALGLFIWI